MDAKPLAQQVYRTRRRAEFGPRAPVRLRDIGTGFRRRAEGCAISTRNRKPGTDSLTRVKMVKRKAFLWIQKPGHPGLSDFIDSFIPFSWW